MNRMLTRIGACFLLILLLSTASRAQTTAFTTDDPVEYSNYIVKEQERIANEFLAFSNVLLNGNDTKVAEARRQEVIRQIELALRRLRNMAPFRGSTTLRDEAVAVFTLYRDVHAGEFARIAAIVAYQNTSIPQLEEYFALQVVAEKKMREYTQRMMRAQQAFAKSSRLTLIENPMQAQFDRILDANIYNREVTLAYLGVAKPNEVWWEAMQQNDVPTMSKARLEVVEAAKVCKLSSMPDFMGDSEFRDAALNRVKYFSELAAGDYVEVEKVISSEKATQADIDRVNGIIDAYNQHNQEQNEAFNAASLALMRKAAAQ